jgi:hypothetical protein
MKNDESSPELESVKEDKSDEYGEYDKWQVEDWARAIQTAEEVRASPEKMKYVLPLLKEKVASLESLKSSISSIADIRAIAKSKAPMDDEEDA